MQSEQCRIGRLQSARLCVCVVNKQQTKIDALMSARAPVRDRRKSVACTRARARDLAPEMAARLAHLHCLCGHLRYTHTNMTTLAMNQRQRRARNILRMRRS